MPARVVEQVLASAGLTLRKMPSQSTRATCSNRAESAHVAWQHLCPVVLQVRVSVLPNNLGERRHSCDSDRSLQISHETIEHRLKMLCAGLSHMHVKACCAHRLVAKHMLNRPQ